MDGQWSGLLISDLIHIPTVQELSFRLLVSLIYNLIYQMYHEFQHELKILLYTSSMLRGLLSFNENEKFRRMRNRLWKQKKIGEKD